jgi:hypothetical protein
VGPASRPSEQAKGGKSYWDPKGGEWRYFPEDEHHNPHWDYNPHQKGTKDGNKWQNIPIDNKPPLKIKPVPNSDSKQQKQDPPPKLKPPLKKS